MISLYGYKPGVDIEIVFTGCGPEKSSTRVVQSVREVAEDLPCQDQCCQLERESQGEHC